VYILEQLQKLVIVNNIILVGRKKYSVCAHTLVGPVVSRDVKTGITSSLQTKCNPFVRTGVVQEKTQC